MKQSPTSKKKPAVQPTASAHSSASPEAWERITTAADAGAPIADLEAEVQGWQPDPLGRVWASMTAWRVKNASQWVQGELRRAPASWVTEMLSGAHAPKHALVRALSLEGTKANATSAARVFENAHLAHLRVLDTGRDLKLARPFFKRFANATNLPALDTLVYYPLQFGGGEELAAGTHFTALKHLHLRAIVYSKANDESARDVDAIMRAPWISQIETLESSMGRSTGWFRLASIYKALHAQSARLTALKRLVLHDTTDLNTLVAAPVLDQIEELVIEADKADALKVLLTALDKRGLPRLRRLDLSQNSVVSAQKKDWFEPQSEARLRAMVSGLSLAKKASEVVLTAP